MKEPFKNSLFLFYTAVPERIKSSNDCMHLSLLTLMLTWPVQTNQKRAHTNYLLNGYLRQRTA